MLTRNRERARFQSYSEDPQNPANSGPSCDGFLSSGSAVLMHEMLDLEDEDVFDTSNDVAVVTTFILDVSTSLEFDNLLNKLVICVVCARFLKLEHEYFSSCLVRNIDCRYMKY